MALPPYAPQDGLFAEEQECVKIQLLYARV